MNAPNTTVYSLQHAFARGFMIILLAALPAAPQNVTYNFEGNHFTLELPPGYQLTDQVSPMRGLMIFGFTTDQRSDGTRGLIELTLLDMKTISDPVTAEQFGASMVGGVRRQRSQWKQCETPVQISGVHATRIAWSGNVASSQDRPPQQPAPQMRGVMIVGIKDRIGFSLHAEDVALFADHSLPLCEKALRTFELEK